MNPPSRSWTFGEVPLTCVREGCASALDTWLLYQVMLRPGVSGQLCSSCIILSHRSLYCCCCFFLLACPTPSSNYDDGDPLKAPPAPTATCQVCRVAVAHLACLYPDHSGAFVCPACRAAAEGRPFTYAPPRRTPLDERAARVLVLAARIALEQLQRYATAVRAEAERLATAAVDARKRANRALYLAWKVLGGEAEPSWNDPIHPLADPRRGPETHLAVPPPQDEQHHRMPPLAALTLGTGNVRDFAMAATEAAKDSLTPPLTLQLFGIRVVETAATKVANDCPPPQFSSQQPSTSSTMLRALQLFQNKLPDDDDNDDDDDDDDEEM